MNEVFSFEGANIRTVMVDDEPMFVGKDVAEALGYSNTADALSKHVRTKHKGSSQIATPSGVQTMTVISEPGIYSLIGRSKLKSAERFQDWVHEEVLPSIRKTGSYAMQPMTTQQQIALIAQGNTELNTKVDTVVSEVHELKEQFGLPAPQAKRLEKVRKKYVVMLLGGFDSNAYRKMSGKVFAEIGRDFKDRFDLPRYDALPMSRFDEAIEYLEHWQLPTNLALDVRDLNAQTALEV